ncbi:MAG: metallophosphoesterase family protein [Anaerolineae bacterium]|nr:metallophosphoesterase family protein [Anaerolineae bacterium]
MRLAIFSDVHANPAALDAFLSDIKERQVDACWSLGDMFGRGWNPNATARLLRRLYNKQKPRHRQAWLLGNHDLMVLGHIPIVVFGPVGGAGGHDPMAERIAGQHHEWLLQNSPECYEWARETVGEGRRKSHHAWGHGVYLAHAAYRYDGKNQVDETASYSAYLNHRQEDAPRDIARCLENLQTCAPEQPRLMLGGHSHVKGLWAWQQGQEHAQRLSDSGGNFELGQQTVFYLNPGSLGFPRDEACPSYALLEVDKNWQQMTIEFVSVRYNGAGVPEDDFPSDYPPQLRESIRRCRSNEGGTP